MKLVVLSALLVMAVACGKNKSSDDSSSSVFRSGLSSCEKSLVIIPTSPQVLPSVVVDSRTYQVGQGTSQQAWQTLTAMYYGQAGVPPYSPRTAATGPPYAPRPARMVTATWATVWAATTSRSIH